MGVLEALLVIILVAWLFGLGFHIGAWINILLLIALIVFIVRLVQGRRVI